MKHQDSLSKFISLRAQGRTFDGTARRPSSSYLSYPSYSTYLTPRSGKWPIAKPVWFWSAFGLEMRQILPVFILWRLTPQKNPQTGYKKVKFC
jgi:hypothetical protein